MDTLLVGNTGYLTKETIEIAFSSDNVVVCDADCRAHKDGNVSFFAQDIMSDKFRRLFDTFSFERVIFFSYSLNKDSNETGEIEQLRRVCSLSQKNKISQFVYLVSDEALVDVNNSDSVIFDSSENICRYYAENYNIDIKMVYSPYLMNPLYKDDYWCRILKKIEDKERVEINFLEDEIAFFLKASDLMEFFYHLFDVWNDEIDTESNEIERIYLKSGAKTTYGEIREAIKEFYPNAEILLSKSGIKGQIEHGENIAREKYGWFARHDACWDFDEYIFNFQNAFRVKPSITQRLIKRFKVGGRFLMILELIGGTALVEVYNYLSSGSVQFSMIDVRLLFVILMSLVYGARIGVLTAFIEITSLVLAYKAEGTNAILLFYDPGNWISFILLLVAAAICGYIKQKKEEDISFVNEENEALKSENAFVSQLYHEAMDYKNRYKADLIGSRDGFGRIFDVVKRLSTTVPEEIFAESIPVMEDVLDNKSIAIYTINDPNARFARLNVSSEKISRQLKKSINLEDFASVLETLKENDIWFNNSVREGFPTYVAGIKSEGHLSVLIMIYNVEYLQISTYYSNLIRILGGLMENFIIKAWEYQRAVAEKTFIEGTSITKTEYFISQFEIQKEMMVNKRTSFRLIRFFIKDKTLEEIDEMFQSKIRNNDVLGLGNDGNIYLLAAQVDDNSESIVLKRFRDMGLKCDVVENVA
ncbi:hypothetical protein [Butyrivibrio sp. YAB3001]|uniref:hypothetical protein n=1 Tax=Butyrivibrio sp. YAB3001 TaxID=1520812 RepID=UPI0008F64503|nr:hypothetical protein [Butyrivibrio sp. YAB3001]SFC10033.1 hypothetical protein SAMN02910398_01488 [Butyrivibrio sp. YAB3001]